VNSDHYKKFTNPNFLEDGRDPSIINSVSGLLTQLAIVKLLQKLSPFVHHNLPSSRTLFRKIIAFNLPEFFNKLWHQSMSVHVREIIFACFLQLSTINFDYGISLLDALFAVASLAGSISVIFHIVRIRFEIKRGMANREVFEAFFKEYKVIAGAPLDFYALVLLQKTFFIYSLVFLVDYPLAVCCLNFGICASNFIILQVVRPYASVIEHFKQTITEILYCFVFSQIGYLNLSTVSESVAFVTSWKIIYAVGSLVIVQIGGGFVDVLAQILINSLRRRSQVNVNSLNEDAEYLNQDSENSLGSNDRIVMI
jgi:hypothetical protein